MFSLRYLINSLLIAGLIQVPQFDVVPKFIHTPAPNITVQKVAEVKAIEKPIYQRDVPLILDIQKYTYDQCAEQGVNYDLVLSLISVESGYDPNAISAGGDYGLMQINKVNHKGLRKELGQLNFLNPYDNIKAGVHMLAGLQTKYNTVEKVLMAYNQGENSMKRTVSRGYTSSVYSREIKAKMGE